MIAYKLVRKLKDGSLAPLFINKKQRLPIGEWMQAEDHPTKGYAVRPGWHCLLKPEASHLSKKGRMLVKVEDMITINELIKWLKNKDYLRDSGESIRQEFLREARGIDLS